MPVKGGGVGEAEGGGRRDFNEKMIFFVMIYSVTFGTVIVPVEWMAVKISARLNKFINRSY